MANLISARLTNTTGQVSLYPSNYSRIVLDTLIMPTVNPNEGDPMYNSQQVNGRTLSVFPELRVFEWRIAKPSILHTIKISSPTNVAGNITFDIKIGDDYGSLSSIFPAPENRLVMLSGNQVAETSEQNLSLATGKLLSIDVISGTGALTFLSAIGYFEEV